MQKIPFGHTGHASSRVIFGAAALGSMRQDKADALLALLFEHGVNHIDTAAMYGDSELRVGRVDAATSRPFLPGHQDARAHGARGPRQPRTSRASASPRTSSI